MDNTPNVGAFVSYMSVPPVRRWSEGQRISLQLKSDYAVETDFWKGMRLAIQHDRKTSRDGQAIRETAQAAVENKRLSFVAVADRWPEIACRWDNARPVKSQGAVVNVAGLDVAVRPLFREMRTDGTIETVHVWMNKRKPSRGAVGCALALLLLAGDDAFSAFVDVRRGRVRVAAREDLDRLTFLLRTGAKHFLRDVA